MKCVKDEKKNVKRLNDELAWELVKSGKYIYCPKEEWKQKVRGYNKEKVEN